MELLVVSTGPPTGTYAATFAGVEACQHDEFGPGLRWKFAVTTGDCAGQIASRTTGTTPSRENACGRVLASLLGRELRIGEQVDPTTLIGRSYIIVVAPAKNGGTRVETVVPTASQ